MYEVLTTLWLLQEKPNIDTVFLGEDYITMCINEPSREGSIELKDDTYTFLREGDTVLNVRFNYNCINI